MSWNLDHRDDVALTAHAGEHVHYECTRCGSELPTIEVTRLGDREAQYIPGAECPCPGPRCPWCRRRVDDDGCCPSLPVVGCWAGGLIIPIPDVA